MEYEIYLLCNLLGIIILFLIIIFHFIDADHENAKSFQKELGKTEEKPVIEKPTRKTQKSKKDKKKSGTKN